MIYHVYRCFGEFGSVVVLCVECWCGLLCSGRGFLFVCTLLVGVWAQVAPVGWSFLLLHVVGAVSVEEPTGD